MKRLFGTDGIRGVAGEPPLDRPTVRRVGAALAEVLAGEDEPAGRVVLGRDTRESGPWLRDALVRGLSSRGVVAVDAGVITTPGLAHALDTGSFDAGVMISASHNPFLDNGLKVFGRGGLKLSDDAERRIEEIVLDAGRPDPPETGARAEDAPGLRRSYVEFLERVIPPSDRFEGLGLTLDCANGAASEIAPEVFRHLGVEVTVIGAAPNGRNINLDCGSLHLDALAAEVRRNGSALGIAFDGDADRALAVDRTGRIVDGDYILYLTGCRLHREGRLRGNAVVATIMSNLWLENRFADEGIALHRASVGDKYVLERMMTEDLVLGGEQSGHVIFREHATTGDGILTGLKLLDTVAGREPSLEAVLDGIQPCPQVQINVRVKSKPDLKRHETLGPAVAEAESALRETGRIVLRYSGTEPVARVMVEDTDAKAARAHAERLAQLIGDELGD